MKGGLRKGSGRKKSAPKLKQNGRRRHLFSLRWSEAEYAEINEMIAEAQAQGMSKTEFLLMAIRNFNKSL